MQSPTVGQYRFWLVSVNHFNRGGVPPQYKIKLKIKLYIKDKIILKNLLQPLLQLHSPGCACIVLLG